MIKITFKICIKLNYIKITLHSTYKKDIVLPSCVPKAFSNA